MNPPWIFWLSWYVTVGLLFSISLVRFQQNRDSDVNYLVAASATVLWLPYLIAVAFFMDL